MADPKSIRAHCEARLAVMKSVRQDYEAEAEQIARFAQPARSRFLASGKDRSGARRRQWNRTLFDPHGIEAFRTLTNGMTSGMSSASRPWFTLKTADDDLMEADGVRAWLSAVERRIYAFLASTNFYGAAKAGYGEMGLFGTEACVMVEHPHAGAVCHALTFGEYWIALSDALVPDTLYRTCPMSVKQAVETFGEAVSPAVRALYDRSQYEAVVEVMHAIEPDPDHDPHRFGSKAWRSVYWEAGARGDRPVEADRLRRLRVGTKESGDETLARFQDGQGQARVLRQFADMGRGLIGAGLRPAIGPAGAERDVDAQTRRAPGLVGGPDHVQEIVGQIGQVAVEPQRIDRLNLEAAETARLHGRDLALQLVRPHRRAEPPPARQRPRRVVRRHEIRTQILRMASARNADKRATQHQRVSRRHPPHEPLLSSGGVPKAPPFAT